MQINVKIKLKIIILINFLNVDCQIKIRFKKARIGRNPKTNEEFQISPRNVISFLPSKLLKDKINT